MLTPLSPAVATACALLGLEYYHTGGGCTALEMTLSDDAFLMITSTVNEACAPATMDEPVLVGTYASVESAYEGEGQWETFPTLRDALLDIYGPIAGAPLPDALK
jgi:hypothetical protein